MNGNSIFSSERSAHISKKSRQEEMNPRIDGTEMTFDSSHFFLENFVPEPSLEFTLAEGSCRHAHGFLATS
jgi:hypothetical protein